MNENYFSPTQRDFEIDDRQPSSFHLRLSLFVVRLAEFCCSSVKVAGAIGVQGGEGSSSDE